MTVYNSSDLFNRRCVSSEKGSICNGKIISPVAVVTTNSDLRGNESVNVTFDNVQVCRLDYINFSYYCYNRWSLIPPCIVPCGMILSMKIREAGTQHTVGHIQNYQLIL